jgi:hypothetical protein
MKLGNDSSHKSKKSEQNWAKLFLAESSKKNDGFVTL